MEYAVGVENTISQRQNNHAPTSRFVNNRPEAIQMRKLRDLAKNSPQNAKLRELHHLATTNPVAQKKSDGKQGFGFVDNRPEVLHQLVTQKMINQPFSNKVNSEAVKTPAILQFVTEKDIITSLRNVAAYSLDMYRNYGEDTIRAVLRESDMRVRGHASGAGGDSQNAATTEDLQALRRALQQYRPTSEAAPAAASGNRGLQHTPTQEDEAKAKKDRKKAEKKDKKKAKYDLAKKEHFGKRPPKGGGGSSSATKNKP